MAYMGDDERFDYVYRFVSRDTFRRGGSAKAARHNRQLLSNGDLSVARFTGDGLEDGVSDGTGEWIPLTRNGRSMVAGFSLDEVLVFTRLAADTVAPTKMDRPEDVEPNLHNGRIYVACTNNTDRGKVGKEGPTEPNPRNANKDGHVVEIIPTGGDHTADTFGWNLFLICGDPATAGTYFGGYDGPVSPISCPDNVAFDSVGNLWVSTDGQPSAIKVCDGLFKVPRRGSRARPRPAVPRRTDRRRDLRTGRPRRRRRSVFVAVQHPGEDGTWAAQLSRFPDFVPRAARPPGVRRPPADGRAGHPRLGPPTIDPCRGPSPPPPGSRSGRRRGSAWRSHRAGWARTSVAAPTSANGRTTARSRSRPTRCPTSASSSPASWSPGTPSAGRRRSRVSSTSCRPPSPRSTRASSCCSGPAPPPCTPPRASGAATSTC